MDAIQRANELVEQDQITSAMEVLFDEIGRLRARPTEGEVAEALFTADYPRDDWSRFKPGDVVNMRYLMLARAVIAKFPKVQP